MILSQDDLRRLTSDEKRELLVRSFQHGDVQVEGTRADQRGVVTIGSADGSVRQVSHKDAHTAYYKPGSIRVDESKPVEYGTVGLANKVYHVPTSVWGDKKYQRRTEQERLDSMTKRYVALVDQIGAERAEPVLREIAGEYWAKGMPTSVEELRRVAARSLNEARMRSRAEAAKMTTAPRFMYG